MIQLLNFISNVKLFLYAGCAFVFLAAMRYWWIARRDYVSAWMQARADAERRRGALFESLLRAEAPVGADLKRLWREKLDLVTSAHIDYQLAYFTSATKKASDCDRKLSWPRKLSLLATVVVAVIGAAGVANYIRDQGIKV